MGCEEFRVELSARLDGEDDPALRRAVDDHLAGCRECAAWRDRAGEVTRLTRRAAALPGPALSPEAMRAVLDAAPAAPNLAAVGKAVRWLRLALLAVGLGQFFLGIAQISAYATTLAAHGHAGTVGSVSSGHLWHESAAWNVAIGAALAWLAWRRSRPAGLIPVMTAFVAVLGLLTANDALVGRVDSGRVLSHALVLAGYALLLVMNLPRLRGTTPPARAQTPGTEHRLARGGDDDGPGAVVYPFPVRASAASMRATVSQRRAA